MTFGVGLGDGVGLGVGVGVGVGVAVGVGGGVAVGVTVGDGDGDGDCACAEDATPMERTNSIATIRTSLWPAPVVLTREGRHEQRIHSIPKSSGASSKNAQNPDRRE